jgi:uncharacterized coiled-coil protein SlyX
MLKPIAVNRVGIPILLLCIVELIGCSIESRPAKNESALSESIRNNVHKPAASEVSSGEVKAEFVNQAVPKIDRKIIYDANIVLVVKDMAETEKQITQLLKQANGYIAEESVDRRQGEHLTGRWRVRVPVAQFDSFLDAVSNLGVAETRNQTAEDVTEQFVDLEAQISNKKKLEERIVALLKDSSGKIKDVIEVEHELARVRGEIEQMEGRLRYLTNRTDFTTISISARVEENYVPPAAPTFSNRIAQAWATSLLALRTFAERLVVAVVFAVPWLVVVSVIAVPAFLYLKWRSAATTKPADPEQPPATASVA